jgi:hypothetical protein
VLVSVVRGRDPHCRYVGANGRLTRARSCRRFVLLRARGKRSWKLSFRVRLPRGQYRVQVRAVDRRGNRERPTRRNVAVVRAR